MNRDINVQDDEQKQKVNVGKMGLAIAATIGTALGLMYILKETEQEKELKKKADELAKKFHKTRKQIQENVKNIFGDVSEELEKKYLELRGNILAELDYIRERALLDKNKYEALIDRAVKEFSKDKKWPEKSVEELKKELKGEWNEIQEMFK